MSKFLKRVDTRNSSRAGPAAADPVLAEGFPAILEYLTVCEWEPGKPREVATMLLLAEGGRWKLQLRDRANKQAVWVSADSIQGALQVLEKALREGSADWRADRPWKGQGRAGGNA